MSASERLLEYIKHPRGHYAYFNIDDDYLKWVTGKKDYDPIEDRIAFCASVNNPCLVSFGDITGMVPKLTPKVRVVGEDETYITKEKYFDTPLGKKGWIVKRLKTAEVEKISEATSCPIQTGEDLALIDWFCERIKTADWSPCLERLSQNIKRIDGRAAVSIFLVPPFELLYWVKREDMFYLYFDHQARYMKAAETIIDAYSVILDVARQAGVQFVFYGAPGGTEFLSPQIWQEAIVPTSAAMEKKMTENGLFSMYHCCGKVDTLCRQGMASAIGPAIFETLSEPEVGDVTDLRAVRRAIDKKIITHGNLDLTLLRDAEPAHITQKTAQILDRVGDYPHLIGASDSCLWPGTPPENIKAIMDMF